MTELNLEKADEARDFLFTIIESLPNGILLAGGDSTLIAINQKGRDILGLAGRSIPRQSCWEIMATSFGVTVAEFADLREPGGRILCEIEGENGKKKYVSATRTELKSPFWQISGFFIALDDVTYLSMVAAQLDRQKRLDAMREMAASMSQELKNPLGSIELYASMLRRELAGDPENERVAVQMSQAVQAMDCILNNYVTFASLPKPRPERLSVRQWLDEVIGILKLMAQGRIEFVCDFQDRDDVLVGDPELLRQLAVNLGLNGIESMSGAGVLTFTTRTVQPPGQRAPFIEVRIVDHGEGISEANLARIFDPFFTTRDRSSGLGLATAHYITAVHQGLISVESKPGKGTTFTLLLPEAG